MWWNVGDKLRQSVDRGQKESHTPGRSDNLTSFLKVMKDKYGTMRRAWRIAIDQDGSGQVTFREFCIAMRDVGYVGSLKTLWFELDNDASGYITLNELDPEAARTLEKFRIMCTKNFKTVQDAWHSHIDEDHSGTVSLPEFQEALLKLPEIWLEGPPGQHLSYTSPAEIAKLFECLREPHQDAIGLKEIEFLQNWEETKMDNKARERHGKRWVNKDPNFQVASQLAKLRTPTPGQVKLEDEEAGRLDYAQIIAYDEQAQWQDFQQFLIRRFGNLPKAYDQMDMNSTGYLSMVEFQSIVCGDLRYCRAADAKRLFLTAVGDDTMITWQEFGITPQEWIQHTHEKRAKQEQVENAIKLGNAGAVARARQAWSKHTTRTRNPKPIRALSFGMPLPRGWGFPPHFDPRNSRKEEMA